MFPDNACRREVQKLEVRCRYAKNNVCPWTGTLGNEEVHYFTCDYRDEQCPNCGVYMMWTKLKKHAELECPMRLIACKYCSESVPVSHEKVCYEVYLAIFKIHHGFQLHILEECRLVELLCPNNCNPNRVMKRDEVYILYTCIVFCVCGYI